jgi:transposase
MDLLNLKYLQQDTVLNPNTIITLRPPATVPVSLVQTAVQLIPSASGVSVSSSWTPTVRGKRVGIWVDRRRLRCKRCGKTFMESLPEMDDRRQATRRLVQYVERESLRRTFASIADDVGLDEKSIRNIFRDYVNPLEQEVRFETPRWMGIDEIHIVKKPRCVISNIEHQTIVEVLPNRNKPTVIKRLQRLPGHEKVQYVAMDMWNPYRDAVDTVFPQARIVIDKFHVVRMANQCLERVRKDLRAQLTSRQRKGLMHDRFVLLRRRHDISDEDYLKLSGWTVNYPSLGAAYDAKEAFYGIWDMDNRPDAESAYEIWRESLSVEMREAFKPILTAMGNWRTEIFNYFDHRITNAYTESLNNLIRVTNRLGRGYSFDALRAKILFTEGVHAIKKPKYPKRGATMEDSMFAYKTFSRSIDIERETNYGTRISTLISLIENSDL